MASLLPAFILLVARAGWDVHETLTDLGERKREVQAEKLVVALGHCRQFSLLWGAMPKWERDYVPNQLLRNVSIARTIEFWDAEAWKRDATFHDCSILVIRRRGFKVRHNLKLVRKMKVQKASFAVVELGAEGVGCTGLDFRTIVGAASVYIRNYWSEDCEAYKEKVVIVPLGTGNSWGLAKSLAPADRRYIWSFASTHLTPTRTSIVEAFNSTKIAPYKLNYPGKDTGK
jgi:hypothetical protein